MFRGLSLFKKGLQDYAEKLPRGAIQAVREEARDWFADIISLTPVDTGFTVSQWKHSINTRPPTNKILNPRSSGPFNPPTVPQFSNLRPGDKLYLYNNVIWIVQLEAGSSDQAPKNFVKNATARANYSLQRRFDGLKW